MTLLGIPQTTGSGLTHAVTFRTKHHLDVLCHNCVNEGETRATKPM
jgi:hypothetical protein